MFTKAELREKGAKRLTLEYIASQDPSIPVPENVGEEHIREGVIVRSNHWREIDGFEGVFESVELGENHSLILGSYTINSVEEAINFIRLQPTGNSELDQFLARRTTFFREYCDAKALDPEEVLSELQILPQKKVESKYSGLIAEHPNKEHRYFLYFQPKSIGFVVDVLPTGKRLIDVQIASESKFSMEQLMGFADIQQDTIYEIVDLYRRVMSLEKYAKDDGVHAMEFTAQPNCVLQTRVFRKKDRTKTECSWKKEKGVIKTNFAFGSTPAEGITLPLFRIEPVYGNQPFSEKYKEHERISKDHPHGFGYWLCTGDVYLGTYIPNIEAAVASTFPSYCNHGGMDNCSNIPLVLFNTRGTITNRRLKQGKHITFFAGNGVGYIKV
ncbi:MAG: hypothetical protein WCV90_01520 [Candidatus Woesearchaeota archaeon]|jgi:hypothetical protein